VESKDRDEFESLLDDALRSYAPDPRAGIESRILYRVRLEGKRGGLWRVSFALAIPALLLTVFVFRPRREAPGKTAVLSIARHAPIPTAPISIAAAANNAAKRQYPKRLGRASPRSDQFPPPSPLTPEERALVQFVSRHPDETREIASKQNEPEPAPIDIPELQISPLPEGGGI
jgi:hypothetical protein